MMGQRIGYVRVSTLDQNEKRQLEGQVLDRIFTDKASGRDTLRPQLTELLRFVRDGDTVVVHSMDRLARNLDDLRAVVQGLTRRGVRVEFIKEQLVFTGEDSPMANLMLSVMGAFAEFERSLIRECQREGIALAQQRGVYKGRKKTLTPERAAELVQRASSGISKAVLARDYGISRETVYHTSATRMEPSPFHPKSVLQLSCTNSNSVVLKFPGEMPRGSTRRPFPGMQKGYLVTAKLPLMLWGTSLDTFVRDALQRTEPTAPPLDELSRDPLAFVAHWVEYASTSSVGQTWIALLALALSSVAFAGQFFKGREADLSVRFAKTPDYKYMADRLIIVNHGAASAKNIKLTLTVKLQAVAEKVRDGVVHFPGQEAGKQQWKPWREIDPFPIPLLAPGASFHLPVRVIGNQLGEAAFAHAKLTWRDKRLLTQSWKSTVSSTGATLGGPSLENFEAERQTKLRGLMP